MSKINGIHNFTLTDFVNSATQLAANHKETTALKLGSHKLHNVGAFNSSRTLQQTRMQFAQALSDTFGDTAIVRQCREELLTPKMSKKPLSARTIIQIFNACNTGDASSKKRLAQVKDDVKKIAEDALKNTMSESPNYGSMKADLSEMIKKEINKLNILDKAKPFPSAAQIASLCLDDICLKYIKKIQELTEEGQKIAENSRLMVLSRRSNELS